MEALLVEVESNIADIQTQAEWAKLADAGGLRYVVENYCQRIRDAVANGDAAIAAFAGCQLGSHLAEIRRLGGIVRRMKPYVTPVDRAHKRDRERREVYQAALRRGFSSPAAARLAAKKLGVTPKTILRAVDGH